MEPTSSGPKWAVRLDARTQSGSYNDQLRVVAAMFELYQKGFHFMAPWINRSRDATMVIPPDKDLIRNALGKPRASISDIVHRNFVDSLYNFACQSKGKRQLINPDPSTHHSAQFPRGTFKIVPITDRQSAATEIHLFSCSEPLIVGGLQLKPEQVEFIIVRPKLGKLGTPSVTNWEILFYKTPQTYLIDHVDSNLNPRWSGVM